MRVKKSKQPPPAPTTSAIGPCPTVIQIVGRPGTGSLPSTIAPPDLDFWDCFEGKPHFIIELLRRKNLTCPIIEQVCYKGLLKCSDYDLIEQMHRYCESFLLQHTTRNLFM